MREPAYWRDLREEFRALFTATPGIQTLCADEISEGVYELVSGPGGPDNRKARTILHQQFTALAVRGGLGLGAAPVLAFHAWIARLVTSGARVQNSTSSGTHPGPVVERNVPFGKIPVPQHVTSDHNVDAPDILLERSHDGRYVFIAGHRKYLAIAKRAKRAKRRKKMVACLVREAGPEDVHRDVLHVGAASIEECVLLETEAQGEANAIPAHQSAPHTSTLSAIPLVTRKPATRRPFVRPDGPYAARASWLDAQMTIRECSTYRLAKVGGLDKNTIKKILSGESVTEETIEKLARALSHCGSPAISLRDVPDKQA